MSTWTLSEIIVRKRWVDFKSCVDVCYHCILFGFMNAQRKMEMFCERSFKELQDWLCKI